MTQSARLPCRICTENQISGTLAVSHICRKSEASFTRDGSQQIASTVLIAAHSCVVGLALEWMRRVLSFAAP